MSDVTRLLNAVGNGDAESSNRLLTLIYDELHRLARQRMRQESPNGTLQATALVNEAWLRLVGSASDQPSEWNSRSHFFAAAAEAMRRILVEAARRRNAQKRGGGMVRLPSDAIANAAAADDEELLALHNALDELQSEDAMAARLVKLRFFAGLTTSEAAEALQMPVRTAHDVWRYARAKLRRILRGD